MLIILLLALAFCDFGLAGSHDWAANTIDRLGGIANWGTSSHHVSAVSSTGGGFPGAFFAGRTLGESLAFAGDAGPNGIIFGDPLYRPAAAKLYVFTERVKPLLKIMRKVMRSAVSSLNSRFITSSFPRKRTP